MGNIFIADTGNAVIREISPSGVINSIAGFFGATDMAVDSAGNLFIADPADDVVLELTATDIFVVAGNGNLGFSGDGGQATSATLNQPTGVGLDYAGNLYIADTGNHRVRMVNTAGVITTVAGTAYQGFSGDGGPANTARLNDPVDVAVDPLGDLYIVDRSNQRIRKVDSTGIITTVVGNGSAGFITGDGLPATSTSLNFPSSIAFDPSGTLYFSDTSNTRIRKVAADGTVQTIAGAALPLGIAFDIDGNLLITDMSNNRILKVSDGNPPTSPLRAVFPSSALRGTLQGGWIAGTNFTGASAVTFSGTGVSATILPGQTQTWLPIAITVAGNAPLGAQSVTVTTPSGVLGPIGGFSIFSGNPFRVESISSTSEWQGTTFQASISGRGFSGATNVAFSGTGVNASILAGGTDTYIPLTIAIDPAAPSGARTITVTTPAGSSDPFNAFTVIQPRLNTINTIAGNGFGGLSGDSGPATSASINSPQGVAVDGAGNVFIADTNNNRVRKVTPAGVITTVAGGGAGGLGDDGPATSASLNSPTDVAVDSLGNLLIADSGNNRIRKVTTDGVIRTVAGSSIFGGFSGDGGLAVLAQLYSPSGVSVDPKGNFYIADGGNARVRRVSALGVISTVAGGGTGGDGGPATSARLFGPTRVSVDQNGNLFIADRNVRKVDPKGTISTFAGNSTADYAGDGGLATLAAFNGITGIAADAAGNVFIADSMNNRVRMVDPSGVVITVAGTGTYGFSGDGGPAISAALARPRGVAVDGSGNLFITDTDNNRVRRVPATVSGAGPQITSISPFYGSQGSAVSATVSGTGLGGVTAVTVSGTGVTASLPGGGSATTLPITINISADAAASPRSLTLSTSTGASAVFNSFTVTNSAQPPAIGLITPSSGIAGTTLSATISGANLTGATGVAFSGNGVTAVLSGGGSASAVPVTLSIAPDASPGARNLTLTTPVATSANFPGFTVIAAGTAGMITTIAGNGTTLFVAGNDPVTSTSLSSPWKAVVDPQGNLIISDRANNRIRKLATNGVWSTVAGTGVSGFSGDGGPAVSAMLANPLGIDIDASGNIFIADSNNYRIRKVSTNGTITTVAGADNAPLGDGGPATSAGLAFPNGVAVDTNGNLFIADTQNNRIRKVDSSGHISTVAGNGVPGFSGDGGPAVSATLRVPEDVAVDAAGNLFIADAFNMRIRKVTAAGFINTVAGSSREGFSGDGGPAVSAWLDTPGSVAVDQAGDLFIADTNNNRIRKVTPDGIITTVAGNPPFVGASGGAYGGDGGPGTSALLNNPEGVSTDSLGNVLIADTNNNRVRKLTFLPTVTMISPSSASLGTTVSATITGADLTGVTGVSFTGSGITAAIGAGATSTTLPVTISISPSAAAGTRPFIVSRSDGSSSIFNGFSVTKKRGGQVTSQ
jgi:sugar lactone lactonase YvrE